MKKTIYTIAITMFLLNFTNAQEVNIESEENVMEEDTSKKQLSITGSIDVYFRKNIDADFSEAPASAFANLPGFSLGMANVIISQEQTNYGFTADLVFGPRGEDATFLSSFLRPEGSSNIINQLYTYWNVNDKLTLTLGNFNTFLGYEVISPTDNFNYSTSYMFSYGPFSHTGFKADFVLPNGFSLMAGVFNPTDATEYNPLNEFATGLQLGYENGGLGIWLNGLFSEDFSQLDVTANYEVNNKLYIGLNATHATDSFYGVAGYLQYATADNLKFGVRLERFTDTGLGIFSGGDLDNEESALDITFSVNYVIGNLTIVPEYRMDIFNTNVIQSESGLKDSISSFVLAAIYDF